MGCGSPTLLLECRLLERVNPVRCYNYVCGYSLGKRYFPLEGDFSGVQPLKGGDIRRGGDRAAQAGQKRINSMRQSKKGAQHPTADQRLLTYLPRQQKKSSCTLLCTFGASRHSKVKNLPPRGELASCRRGNVHSVIMLICVFSVSVLVSVKSGLFSYVNIFMSFIPFSSLVYSLR